MMITFSAEHVVASADRRPIDPPPVVELRILEGDARNDITFSHNANFFLYTTLESARPIAQGRANALPAPFPVLTGMPVAGMAYLDRPSPAGYFIFPDLSVRHEGKYRLSFNLFEELKEARDADSEPAISNPDHPNNKVMRSSPMAPQAHVHFRLEVKSEPFIVFSAKKFPGLAESTALSRVVAEQGCRVRIRRDVRMRRRDTKAGKDYDEYDDDATNSRTDRFTTPDIYPQAPSSDRARSISNVSVDVQAPYNSMEQRRPSVQDLGYYNQNSYQHVSAAPVHQPTSNSYGSHLSFGGSSTPHYQTPAMPSAPQPIHQPAQSYITNNTAYQYQPAPQLRQQSTAQNYGYGMGQAYQQPQYQNPQQYEANNEYRPLSDYRRTSLPPNQPSYPSQPVDSYPAVDSRLAYGQQQQQQQQQQQNYYSQPLPPAIPGATGPSHAQVLPPLKTLQPISDRNYEPERRYEPVAPAKALPSSITSIAIQPGYDSSHNICTPWSATNQISTETSARSSKRSFAKVFDSAHISQSVHSGMRPDSMKHGQDVTQIQLDDGTLVDEDEELPNLKLLSYRRADGSRQHKKCPSPIVA